MWGVNRAATDDHLPRTAGGHRPTFGDIFHSNCCSPFQHDTVRVGASDDLQIAPLPDRLEIGGSAAAPSATFLRDLDEADALLSCPIEIIIAQHPYCHSRLYKGRCERIGITQVCDTQRAVAAMVGRCPATIALRLLKIGQHLIVLP